MNLENQNLVMAEAQLRGFLHGKQGFNVESLVEAMALELSEWEELKANNTGYLDAETIKSIDAYFEKD